MLLNFFAGGSLSYMAALTVTVEKSSIYNVPATTEQILSCNYSLIASERMAYLVE